MSPGRDQAKLFRPWSKNMIADMINSSPALKLSSGWRALTGETSSGRTAFKEDEACTGIGNDSAGLKTNPRESSTKRDRLTAKSVWVRGREENSNYFFRFGALRGRLTSVLIRFVSVASLLYGLTSTPERELRSRNNRYRINERWSLC